MQAYYVAIIERAEGGFSVFFPDLPGCTSAGETAQLAALNAAEALALHLAGMAEDGDAIPAATALDDIPLAEDGEVGRVLVAAEMPGRSVRLSITMDEGLIAAIDRVAPNRSGFLAQAARSALAVRQG